MPLTQELPILAVLLVAVEEIPTLPSLWSKDLVFKAGKGVKFLTSEGARGSF